MAELTPEKRGLLVEVYRRRNEAWDKAKQIYETALAQADEEWRNAYAKAKREHGQAMREAYEKWEQENTQAEGGL